MKTLKAHLLAATVVAAGIAGTAQAQFAYPAADLRGAGASSIQNVLVQSLNCIGNPGDHSAGNTDRLNLLGTNNGTTSAVAEGAFVQTRPTKASPDYNCDRQEIQPNFEGHYIATGSGTGRIWWRTFTSPLDGSTGRINPFGNWTNIQFAFSDAPASGSDLTAYNAGANNSTNRAGAAIQVPLYVLPVSVAYNPVYGVKRAGRNKTQELRFAVNPKFVTKDADGNATGGLRLSQNLYCRIFNGYVTNFNDRVFNSTGTRNTLMDANDVVSRWRQTGVPIRLVGRLDNSGTTDIFTRHLAAACSGQAGVAVNKFAKNSEALPFDRNSAIDLRSFRSDTRYFTNTTGDLAGTVQSLSGAVFVRAASGNPARIDTTQGQERAGLFLVADGSSGVRDAINFQAQPGNQSGSVALNGKLGYIGADFVRPSTDAQLFSAALQIGGSGSQYAVPTAASATAAFGGFLPPQTTAANGAYSPADSRTGPGRDGTGTVPIDRSNPLHWISVLYATPSNSLANPRLGYPITGTTNFLGYTCYATTATRLSVNLFLTAYMGSLTKNSANGNVSAGLFTSTNATNPGLLAQLNIAPLPQSWRTAITDTFLRKSSNAALGNRNLWISSLLPTKNANQAKANPNCTTGRGA